MQHRRIGNSSLSVSTIGLGAWLTMGQTVAQSETTALVRKALDLGVTFFDTADVYGQGIAETAWGRAFEGVNRDHYVLATKCFFPMSDHRFDRGLSRKHIRASIDHSLERLKTDHVDLYQCHRFDPDAPLEELVRTMDDLVTAGKILHWGVSYWTGAQITNVCRIAEAAGREKPISNQPPYNLLDRAIEPEVIPVSREFGLSQVVFSPLAQGVLSGKYSGGKRPPGSRAADPRSNAFIDRYLDPTILTRVDQAKRLAEAAGVTLPQASLRWCLRDPNVASVIVGVTSEKQLIDDVKAESVAIGPELLDAIGKATAGTPA